MNIYQCKDTKAGKPLVLNASKDELCIVTEDPATRKSTIVIISGEEAMKMAFAIAEHFSGEGE